MPVDRPVAMSSDYNTLPPENITTISASATSVYQCASLNIAVMYGAYHIEDLVKQFTTDLKLELDATSAPQSFTAWRIPSPEYSNLATQSTPLVNYNSSVVEIAKVNAGEIQLNLTTRYAAGLSAGVCLYLLVGATDWWILWELLLRSVQMIRHGSANISVSITSIVYLVLYAQRHLAILRKISYAAIQWDRSLFEYI